MRSDAGEPLLVLPLRAKRMSRSLLQMEWRGPVPQG